MYANKIVKIGANKMYTKSQWEVLWIREYVYLGIYVRNLIP